MYLWIIGAIVAYFIKGMCGFANTLIFTTILSFGENNINISPIDLLMGYPSNIILTIKNRDQLDKSIYGPLVCLVIFGSIPGVFLLRNVDTSMIKLIFGVVVVILAIEILFRQYQKTKQAASNFVLMMIGILSGLLCGMFGIGALLAGYVSRVTDHQASFKANMSVVFIVDNTLRIVLYSCLHIITLSTIKMSLLLFPFVMLGLYLGMKCSDLVSEKYVYHLTAILLLVSGISLILKSI